MPSAVEEESLRRRIHHDEQTTTSDLEEERISTVERVELGDISHHDKKNLVQQSYQGVQGVSASVYDETTTKNPDSTHHMGFEVNDTEGDNVEEDNTEKDNVGQLFMAIRNRAAATADLTDSQEQVHGYTDSTSLDSLQPRLTSHPGIRCLAVSELHIDLAHPEHRSPSSREPGGHTDSRSASADRG